MINKALLLFILLFSSIIRAAGEDQQLQRIKSMISPQQIEMIIQKFQPQMKPEQRSKLSKIVQQQQIDNLSLQEASQFANAKMIDMPNLVQKRIRNMPPSELKQIKQTLQLQKTPKQ